MPSSSLNEIDLLVLARIKAQENRSLSAVPLRFIQNQLDKKKGAIIRYNDRIDFEKLGIAIRGKVVLSVAREQFCQLIKKHPGIASFHEEQGRSIMAELDFRHQQECKKFLTELEKNCSFVNKTLFNLVRDTKQEDYLCREYRG